MRIKLNLQGKFRLFNKKLGTKLQRFAQGGGGGRPVAPPPESTPDQCTIYIWLSIEICGHPPLLVIIRDTVRGAHNRSRAPL